MGTFGVLSAVGEAVSLPLACAIVAVSCLLYKYIQWTREREVGFFLSHINSSLNISRETGHSATNMVVGVWKQLFPTAGRWRWISSRNNTMLFPRNASWLSSPSTSTKSGLI
jgi:hypothetical protein